MSVEAAPVALAERLVDPEAERVRAFQEHLVK
jgi:hypothetical protein